MADALEQTVVLKVASAQFLGLGEKFPQIFRPIGQELARRLYQRNLTIFVPNVAPKLFIISSSEAKDIAHAVRDGLESVVDCVVWDKGVFFAGGYPLDALATQVEHSDFALAIATADDILTSRGMTTPTVLFELGLFMGTLTRYRAILAHPKIKDLKLPSDLQGLTVIQYEHDTTRPPADIVKPVCDKVGELVRMRGVRTFTYR